SLSPQEAPANTPCRYVAPPDRLRRPQNPKSLPRKYVSQAIQRQVIRELAGHDIGQQTGPRHALVDRRFWLRRHLHLRILAPLLASQASIFFADVLNALEAARGVLDLPALVRTNLFPLYSAAGADSFRGTEFVDLGCDRKLFEVGQVPSPWPPLHPTQLVCGFRLAGHILRADRLLIQLLSKLQQCLGEILARSQPISTRPVIPFFYSVPVVVAAADFPAGVRRRVSSDADFLPAHHSHAYLLVP